MKEEIIKYDELMKRIKVIHNRSIKYEIILILCLIIGVCVVAYFTIANKDIKQALTFISPIIIVMPIVMIIRKKRRDKHLKELETYREEIDNYCLVYDGCQNLYTNKHIISMHLYYDEVYSLRVVDLSEIVSIEEHSATKNYSNFHFHLKNNKTVILVLPIEMRNLLIK